MFFIFTLFYEPLSSFGIGRTGRFERDTNEEETTKTPTLFQTKTKTVPDLSNESQKDQHDDPFHYLENHFRSLRQIFHPKKDSKHGITDVTNLFACLEPDSPISGCDKPTSFRYFCKLFL